MMHLGVFTSSFAYFNCTIVEAIPQLSNIFFETAFTDMVNKKILAYKLSFVRSIPLFKNDECEYPFYTV
jgi:hypothetical protein